jgi:hypothetical protein
VEKEKKHELTSDVLEKHEAPFSPTTSSPSSPMFAHANNNWCYKKEEKTYF